MSESQPLSRLLHALDRLGPPGDASDLTQLYRTRLTVMLLVGILLVSVANGVSAGMIGAKILVVVPIGIASLAAFLLFRLRRGMPQRTAAMALVVVAQTLLTVILWVTGGLVATLSVAYLATSPLIALALLGRREARASMVLVMVALTVVLACELVPGLPSPPPKPEDTPARIYVAEVLFVAFVGLLSVFHAHLNARQHEALEEARNEAQRANRAKSAFLANMSHELRTPMNGVLGLTRVLLLDERLAAEHRDTLEVVQTSGTTLVDLLNDILDLSKIESGRLELERVPLDPVDLVNQISQLIEPAAREKGLEFSVETSGVGPILADPTRLRQVLMNLVGNAVKFTSAGSVFLRLRPGPDTLRIEVQDTGIGISADVRDAIFEPFSQADVSTTRRFGGTGLGLTISRHLVALMGGSLEVDSRPGEGSTFGFTIPAPPAELPAPLEAQHVPAGLPNQLRVLVAEDIPVNQLVARRLLAQFDIESTMVEDGDMAVRAVRSEDWDLIFMDVHMPGTDGLEATRQLRAAGVVTPIIAMTASTMAEDRATCFEAGMNGFLAKPVRLEALQELLVNELGGLQTAGRDTA